MEKKPKEQRKKIVPGFSRYTVTQHDGTFVNSATGTVLLPNPHNGGKIRMFNDEGKRTWIDPVKKHAEVWPPSGNVKHIKDDAVRAGRAVQKPKKLTPDDVRELRRLATEGWTKRQLEERFHICQQTAGKIIRRVYYPNVI